MPRRPLSTPEVLDAAAVERALQAVYVHKASKLGNRFHFSWLDPVWK